MKISLVAFFLLLAAVLAAAEHPPCEDGENFGDCIISSDRIDNLLFLNEDRTIISNRGDVYITADILAQQGAILTVQAAKKIVVTTSIGTRGHEFPILRLTAPQIVLAHGKSSETQFRLSGDSEFNGRVQLGSDVLFEGDYSSLTFSKDIEPVQCGRNRCHNMRFLRNNRLAAQGSIRFGGRIGQLQSLNSIIVETAHSVEFSYPVFLQSSFSAASEGSVVRAAVRDGSLTWKIHASSVNVHTLDLNDFSFTLDTPLRPDDQAARSVIRNIVHGRDIHLKGDLSTVSVGNVDARMLTIESSTLEVIPDEAVEWHVNKRIVVSPVLRKNGGKITITCNDVMLHQGTARVEDGSVFSIHHGYGAMFVDGDLLGLKKLEVFQLWLRRDIVVRAKHFRTMHNGSVDAERDGSFGLTLAQHGSTNRFNSLGGGNRLKFVNLLGKEAELEVYRALQVRTTVNVTSASRFVLGRHNEDSGPCHDECIVHVGGTISVGSFTVASSGAALRKSTIDCIVPEVEIIVSGPLSLRETSTLRLNENVVTNALPIGLFTGSTLTGSGHVMGDVHAMRGGVVNANGRLHIKSLVNEAGSVIASALYSPQQYGQVSERM